MKIVRKEKKYKIQRKKTVCEIVNFDSTKLTKKKKNLERQQMAEHFHKTFIILLYFILTYKKQTLQQL